MKADEFKPPPGIERWPDGEPILVVRPAKPTLAVSLAEVAVKHQSVDALAHAMSAPATFMGYLKRTDGYSEEMQRELSSMIATEGVFMSKGAEGGVIVDENGKNPQPLKAGDIFVSRHELSQPD